jgi:hypothetical protein
MHDEGGVLLLFFETLFKILVGKAVFLLVFTASAFLFARVYKVPLRSTLANTVLLASRSEFSPWLFTKKTLPVHPASSVAALCHPRPQ